jgi:hypothetical protein
MMFHRPHHQRIFQVLQKFNANYLAEHSILFGGGTRIALEIEEYRESIDIDFFCATPQAYRAVREHVGDRSIGVLLTEGETISFARDIRSDRDAVRAFIEVPDAKPIKLEFVHFDYYDLRVDHRTDIFPVPFIDRESCFLTKLLANADRYHDGEKKDIFDLCMMHHYWGAIPERSWVQANEKYGLKTVYSGLEKALDFIFTKQDQALKIAVDVLNIEPSVADAIVKEYAKNLFDDLLRRKGASS